MPLIKAWESWRKRAIMLQIVTELSFVVKSFKCLPKKKKKSSAKNARYVLCAHNLFTHKLSDKISRSLAQTQTPDQVPNKKALSSVAQLIKARAPLYICHITWQLLNYIFRSICSSWCERGCHTWDNICWGMSHELQHLPVFLHSLSITWVMSHTHLCYHIEKPQTLSSAESSHLRRSYN